jgi:hypothetical protein
MNRDDMAAVRATADRREAEYRAHFDGCPDCPGSPDGECARAQELYRAWTAARELSTLRCQPGQDQPQEHPRPPHDLMATIAAAETEHARLVALLIAGGQTKEAAWQAVDRLIIALRDADDARALIAAKAPREQP